MSAVYGQKKKTPETPYVQLLEITRSLAPLFFIESPIPKPGKWITGVVVMWGNLVKIKKLAKKMTWNYVPIVRLSILHLEGKIESKCEIRSERINKS